jgi:hypothetical protein
VKSDTDWPDFMYGLGCNEPVLCGSLKQEHDDPPVEGGYTGQRQVLKPGLYRLHWVSGGSSLAAVGVMAYHANWFAPINWVSGGRCKLPTGIACTDIGMVKRFEPIEVP